MFGFYDPASLSVSDRTAVISFINATDAADVRTVRIDTAEDARRVRNALSAQKTLRISALEGTMREVHGSIRMNPDHPGEGVMVSVQDPKRQIPIKLAFDPAEGSVPEKGIGIVYGREQDGALEVCRMVVRPIGPVAKPRHAPDGQSQST